jgi:hypothetical protein
MNVAELIVELQKLPQDSEVVILRDTDMGDFDEDPPQPHLQMLNGPNPRQVVAL